MQKEQLHRLNKVVTWLIAAMAIVNITWLIVAQKTWSEITFRSLQYVAMILIMQLPRMLMRRFSVEVPWLLSALIVLFCFSSLVLGDGLDLYGRIPWWDKLLHAESGVLLSMIALWLIHVIMAEKDKYIYFNKYFLCLFLVLFSLGLGACWEIIEYTYDDLMDTNSQQFMASTTGSIITADDVPLCGHDALRDSMQDLILDLLGALLVATYGFFRHNKLVERYKQLSRKMK
jgi:hypothetical protein